MGAEGFWGTGYWGTLLPDEAWGVVAWLPAEMVVVLALIALLLLVLWRALPPAPRRGGTFGRDW